MTFEYPSNNETMSIVREDNSIKIIKTYEGYPAKGKVEYTVTEMNISHYEGDDVPEDILYGDVKDMVNEVLFEQRKRGIVDMWMEDRWSIVIQDNEDKWLIEFEVDDGERIK